MSLRRTVMLVALAALLVPLAHAAQSPVRVKGIDSIGAFRVTGGPADARRAFGKPASTRETDTSCTMTWPGLRISFYTLLDRPQCGDSAFESATISRAWVTDRGLRRGDAVSRLKSLYPRARDGGNARSSMWLVRKTSPAIGDYGLSVRVRDGRVTALDLLRPLGGE